MRGQSVITHKYNKINLALCEINNIEKHITRTKKLKNNINARINLKRQKNKKTKTFKRYIGILDTYRCTTKREYRLQQINILGI